MPWAVWGSAASFPEVVHSEVTTKNETTMKTMYSLCALLLCWCGVAAAQTVSTASLRGTVTDPSGALVPGALVQLRGPGGNSARRPGWIGQYNFTNLRAGKFTVRVIAKGFTVSQKQNFEISGPMVLDAQLSIHSDTQVLNVEDEANAVSADPRKTAARWCWGRRS